MLLGRALFLLLFYHVSVIVDALLLKDVPQNWDVQHLERPQLRHPSQLPIQQPPGQFHPSQVLLPFFYFNQREIFVSPESNICLTITNNVAAHLDDHPLFHPTNFRHLPHPPLLHPPLQAILFIGNFFFYCGM